MSNKCLMNLDELKVVAAGIASAPTLCGFHIARIHYVDDIIDDFPELFSPVFNSQIPTRIAWIVTDGPHIHACARRIKQEHLEIAKLEFFEMDEMGIFRRSSSLRASPLHIVLTPGGGWRPSGNFRCLNNAVVDDRYPLPHIHNFNGSLASKKILLKIDLVCGYQQIPIESADIPKTVIITPFKLWEFLRMPFEIKNATQAFQRLLHSVFGASPLSSLI